MRADLPTLTSIGVQVTYAGDDNRNASGAFRYRAANTTEWLQALPLFRVRPETVAGRSVPRQLSGSVLDVRPDTSYQVEVVVQDPDGGGSTLTATIHTLPIPPANPAAPRPISVTDVAGLNNALRTVRAGDVITLQPGTYNVQSLFLAADGAAANPIILRGASQTGVILDGGNCGDCNVIEIYGSYITLESLTIRNAFQAVRFQTAGARGNVLRRLLISNVANGVNGRDNQQQFYYGDNVVEGRLQFPLVYDSDNGANGDSYGFALYGAGHAVAHNRISGFANSITFRQPGARAVDIYGNDILYCYDDAIELDSTEGNVRAFRNRVTNSYTALSVQPVYGGPAYIVRNTGYNIKYEQIKFHSNASNPPQHPSGVLVYHNTFVSPTRALTVLSPLPNYNSVLMNNLFIGPAAPHEGQTADWSAPIDGVAFDYNGYFPDGKFFFRTPVAVAVAPSLAAVVTTFGLEQHGRVMNAATLAGSLIGPIDFQTRKPPTDPVLSSTSLAADAALALPNINAAYSGAAPDMGALERGCPAPVYGPRTTENEETNPAAGCAPAPPPPVTPPPPTPAPLPEIVSASVGGRTNSSRQIAITAAHASGAASISSLSVRLGATSAEADSCAIDIDRSTGVFHLWNDSGSTRSSAASGSAAILSNSRCAVAAQSVRLSAAGTQLVWSFKVTFASSYRQQKTVFALAASASVSSGWKAAAATN
jgi:hypothetical protein